MKQEELIKKQLSQYLKLQYPNIIYRWDIGADIKLTIGSAKKSKSIHRHERGYPDLFIASAKHGYFGMFLEVKVSEDKVYKKNGGLRKDKHVEEQFDMIERLNDAGYFADFCFGFDDCKHQIDLYLSGADTDY